jgi:phosphoribosyl-ATP pyrophosphohydrolase/phosphoribosyl-AMP cyclohydrolase
MASLDENNGVNEASNVTLEQLRFDDRGLLPVVTQDAQSGEVLMLAYANREALEHTLQTKQAHYYSRSRDELWHKGATSGHVQDVVEVRVDCDEDTVLYRVLQTGAACHTGAYSCFFRNIQGEQQTTIGEMMMTLERIIDHRLQELPEGSYVRKMHERGVGYVSQKVVEEAGESIVAALEDKPDELVGEVADLFFHTAMLLREKGISMQDIAAKLAERHQEKVTTDPSSTSSGRS